MFSDKQIAINLAGDIAGRNASSNLVWKFSKLKANLNMFKIIKRFRQS